MVGWAGGQNLMLWLWSFFSPFDVTPVCGGGIGGELECLKVLGLGLEMENLNSAAL